jgi:peptidoglycan/LPS O-acetylase OafA/YrhL
VQVFFVVGGYVLAASLARRAANARGAGRYLVSRYCRLGLPYLAAIGLALVANEFARGWLDESVIGAPPTLPQVLANLAFLQDILGYESLSAGLWYVCIDFQLTLLYLVLWFAVGAMHPRGAKPPQSRQPLGLGATIAVASLFYFNEDETWDAWAVYYFAHFYTGVITFAALQSVRVRPLFWTYIVLVVLAIADQWRPQLVASLATGLVLFAAGQFQLLHAWPSSRLVSFLGRTSYSLFLVHFPVLIAVLALWTRWGWLSGWGAGSALAVIYALSLLIAVGFYRAIEQPAESLSHRMA